MIRKWEKYEIKYKYCNFFLKYTNFNDNLVEYKCLLATKINNNSLNQSKNNLLIHTNFLTTTITSLFYCCGKVFILISI